MNFLNIIPLLIRHGGKTFITENSSIIHNNVNSTERVKTSLYNCLTVFHRMTITNCFSTKSFNFLDNFIRISDIVDNDTCTKFCQ